MSHVKSTLVKRDSNTALEQFLDDYRRRLQLARLRSALAEKGTLAEEPRALMAPRSPGEVPHAGVRRLLARLRRACHGMSVAA